MRDPKALFDAREPMPAPGQVWRDTEPRWTRVTEVVITAVFGGRVYYLRERRASCRHSLFVRRFRYEGLAPK